MATNQIQPAITAEEWDRLLKELAAHSWALGSFAEDYTSDPFAVVAAANAALPDDDPRRITATDVASLDEAIEFVEPLVDREEPLKAELTALRNKLAALLPPDR